MNNRKFTTSDTLPATVSAIGVAIAGSLTFLAYDFGTQSTHMALHIAAMNVTAPLAAALLSKLLPSWVGQYRTLWLSALAQISLLWAWHVPSVQHAVAASHGHHVAAHAALFFSSFVFWSSIIRLPEAGRWQAIAALLLTGKLACLLSALLIFSPRALYDTSVQYAQLDDQQLAGLLMITACPLSYLIAAIILATQLFNRISHASNVTSTRPG